MARFYGIRSVLADYKKHLRGTGKVVTSSLYVRLVDAFPTTETYQSYYPPDTESTALGRGGMPLNTVQVTLWQMGQTNAPRPDDNIAGPDGKRFLVVSVQSRLNADAGYGVHECSLMRAA
jgi:hypothetical protein